MGLAQCLQNASGQRVGDGGLGVAVEMHAIKRRRGRDALHVEAGHLQLLSEAQVARSDSLRFCVALSKTPGQRLRRDPQQGRCHQHNVGCAFGTFMRPAMHRPADVVNEDAGAGGDLFGRQVEVVLAVVAAQRQHHDIDRFVSVQSCLQVGSSTAAVIRARADGTDGVVQQPGAGIRALFHRAPERPCGYLIQAVLQLIRPARA